MWREGCMKGLFTTMIHALFSRLYSSHQQSCCEDWRLSFAINVRAGERAQGSSCVGEVGAGKDDRLSMVAEARPTGMVTTCIVGVGAETSVCWCVQVDGHCRRGGRKGEGGMACKMPAHEQAAERMLLVIMTKCADTR